ncbi:uncharacterized protein SAPINGB_P003987 [Magnusiomyces paraingens]|uniref:Protein LOT5 n=1 Tax=Magnusiomyces paraingens TaxID=2606893 RepID=A0A5E8BT75_9ASCO|nr:uncharacterized protein SAPINGB_P003987 [Saprochaete ingens]VVT54261.1 unnamed protein product [Saprochaete ingens]
MTSPLTITSIDADPLPTEFVSLAEYRSSTPASFALEESPVLYYVADNLPLEAPHLDQLLRCAGSNATEDVLTRVKSACESGSHQILANVKISSSRFFLWLPEYNQGVAIPYTSITLHGITRVSVLYLQLSLPDPFPFLELWLATPTAPAAHSMYESLNACANLHADPPSPSSSSPITSAYDDLDMTQPRAFDLSDFGTDADVDVELDGYVVARTTGTADDLDGALGGAGEAGLEISFQEEEDSVARAGTRRAREDEDEDEDGVRVCGVGERPVDSATEGTGKWRRVS